MVDEQAGPDRADTGDEQVTGAQAHVGSPLSDAEVAALREQFAILGTTVREGQPLVYLDSGATSHKPARVLDVERRFYETHNAAPHRGAHHLSELGTEDFEDARATIARFIGARPEEVVFTKNATESLNLVAYAFSNAPQRAGEEKDPRFVLGPGDEVLVTEMEHHANLVPWQELAKRTGATLRWIPVRANGTLDLEAVERDGLINERTQVVAFTHVSNVLGTVNPVTHLAERAHAVGALVVLDACQSVPHLPVDVKTLGVDLLAFSGHKMYGPMGIGVLWGRYELLDAMPPFLTGGSMIESVRMEETTYAPPPQKFEAGVPNAAQAIALAEAVRWIESIGMERLCAHEKAMTQLIVDGLAERPWVTVVGPHVPTGSAGSSDAAGDASGTGHDTSTPADDERGGAVAFVVDGVHAHDVGQILDDAGVAVRVGHHCAWPLHRALKVQATTRASVAAYTSRADVDAFLAAMDRIPKIFGLDTQPTKEQ